MSLKNQLHNMWIAGLLLLMVMVGCTSEETTAPLSAEQRFKMGFGLFQDEDYLEAIEEFKVVTIQFGGTQWADDAQYYMAEARFRREEYILAAYEFDVLVRSMPTSEFVRMARFRRASCYDLSSPGVALDQENTRKAIDEYQNFLEYHAADSLAPVADRRIRELTSKLAEKEFNNGVIYLKMGYNKAATYYFDLVLEKYHDTPFAEPSHVRKAEALIQRKRYDEAVQELNRFLDRYPSSSLRAEAETLRQAADEGKASKPSTPSGATQGAS
jgi:outer membrane protein assembly factor BamD